MQPDQDSREENDQVAAPREETGAMPRKFIARSFLPLTVTEKRVLDLVSQSKTNREIAEHLRISVATVKRHVENILKKLNLRNRIEAAIYALSAQRCPDGNGGICPLENWWRKNT